MQIRPSVLLGYKNNGSPMKTVKVLAVSNYQGARKIAGKSEQTICVFLHMSMSIYRKGVWFY